jgi:hypothetical protein
MPGLSQIKALTLRSTSKYIKVVAIMPYNRDEVIASVTEFYTFLTTHVYFDPSELKTPPPAG